MDRGLAFKIVGVPGKEETHYTVVRVAISQIARGEAYSPDGLLGKAVFDLMLLKFRIWLPGY